ncbi:MAG TPA: hypothetical protein DCW90_04895 [Lachnospiraceae bacterium]|nr:hypothetical protein [Lachnospiraceae bacterium]
MICKEYENSEDVVGECLYSDWNKVLLMNRSKGFEFVEAIPIVHDEIIPAVETVRYMFKKDSR